MRVVQINLQHSKAASAGLCRILSTGNIDIGLIQEPWQYQGKVKGLGNIRGKLIYDLKSEKIRTCIFVRNDIQILKVNEFCYRDLTTIRINSIVEGISTETIIASTYLPYDSPNPPPSKELEDLTTYCRAQELQLIIGADANSQNEVWGSTKTNQRGEYLLDFIVSSELEILNQGTRPTFVTKNRKEVIDITLATRLISTKVVKWYVSEEPSLSDHRYIFLEIGNHDKTRIEYRNPRNTNWTQYKEDLKTNLLTVKKVIRNQLDVETATEQLLEAIITSYQNNCPLTRRSTRASLNWWGENLEELRKKTRKAFNLAKKTSIWEEYKSTLLEYKKEIRSARRDAWRKLCTDVNGTSEGARLQKILSKAPTNPIGTVVKPDGTYTETGKETAEVLLHTHFPGSVIIDSEETPTLDSSTSLRGATRESWEDAKRIINYDCIKWAINTFEKFKSPGPDGIFPILLQEGLEYLLPTLCQVFRGSLALKYVPGAWKKVKVVFIPKPGKDLSQAKAYRPISLSSFLLKTLEKIIDRHIRETSLKMRPLHPNQHAYQIGKSCESALHQLVHRIENSLENQEIAFGAFLDIEGVCDNTSIESILRAASRHGVENTICQWIKSMLLDRQVHTEIFNETLSIIVTGGCPQGGVLSPLLWNLVVNELLEMLNDKGFCTQGYADDIVILIQGKHPGTLTELMTRALTSTERWCRNVGLRVNPTKTALIPFTRKRKLEGLNPPIFFNQQLQLGHEVKYLGLILDTKLTWNQHLQYITSKAKKTLMFTRIALGKTWGLQPNMVYWIYTVVVRPIITYGCTMWWPKLEQSTAKRTITRVQRLACLCITGAIRSTPTASMETLINLTPLDILVKGEARLGAHRLKLNNNWKPGSRHAQIEGIVTTPLLEMGSDYMTTKFSFTQPFKVNIERDEKTIITSQDGLVWYTDGSKRRGGTGAGVHAMNPRSEISISLGTMATVYQAEIYAINECILENIRRQYNNKRILIYSDSQAVLKALGNPRHNSKLTWECLQNLIRLSTSNSVTLSWVPGHRGNTGNEIADTLAKQGAENPNIGPEPMLGIPKNRTRADVREWMTQRHSQQWLRLEGHKLSKKLMRTPSKRRSMNALRLNRTNLRKVTGIITGHCNLKKHLHNMGLTNEEPICRLCNEEDETASHIIFECMALENWRFQTLGSIKPWDDTGNLIDWILELAQKTGLFD